jgi:hypothetical protein
MELWDDQVNVHHVIISGILQVKKGFWTISILYYALFQSLNSFVGNFENSQAFLEQHGPFHTSIRVKIIHPILQKE